LRAIEVKRRNEEQTAPDFSTGRVLDLPQDRIKLEIILIPEIRSQIFHLPAQYSQATNWEKQSHIPLYFFSLFTLAQNRSYWLHHNCTSPRAMSCFPVWTALQPGDRGFTWE